MKLIIKILLLCFIIGMTSLWGCRRQVPSHSRVWLRCGTNEWKRSADWEFEDKGNGRYALYNKNLCLDFIVDVKSAGKWNFRMWGGNDSDSLLVPNAPYQLGREWEKSVQCGYNIIHCDSIVLITSDNKQDATITLHTSQPMQEFTLLNDTTAKPSVTHHLHTNNNLQVLVVGNSLSGYNNQDSMFNAIARQSDISISLTSHWEGGATLKAHWNEGIFTNISSNPTPWWLIFSRPWTHIALQEFSLQPLYDPEGFAESVHKWVKFIRRYSSNHDAEILLVMNWPRAFLWNDYTHIHKLIAHNSRVVANREGITLCPVGDAYESVFESEGPEAVKVLYVDEIHPSIAASFLAACIKFAQITSTSPTDIGWQPAELTHEEANKMRLLAAQALQKKP